MLHPDTFRYLTLLNPNRVQEDGGIAARVLITLREHACKLVGRDFTSAVAVLTENDAIFMGGMVKVDGAPGVTERWYFMVETVDLRFCVSYHDDDLSDLTLTFSEEWADLSPAELARQHTQISAKLRLTLSSKLTFLEDHQPDFPALVAGLT